MYLRCRCGGPQDRRYSFHATGCLVGHHWQLQWHLQWHLQRGCHPHPRGHVPGPYQGQSTATCMGLLPYTQNRGLRMRRECRERFPRHWLQRKLLVSDPGMHQGACVTHVLWCMSGLLNRGGGKTFPTFPAHAQPAILRIWQEAHVHSNTPRDKTTFSVRWRVWTTGGI